MFVGTPPFIVIVEDKPAQTELLVATGVNGVGGIIETVALIGGNVGVVHPALSTTKAYIVVIVGLKTAEVLNEGPDVLVGFDGEIGIKVH